ncbi:unnamed protein product [Choristocarpus tenellus]
MYFTVNEPREGGERACVVTNDEMRNHRVELLEPTPFDRWKKTQVSRFHLEVAGAEGRRDEDLCHTKTTPSNLIVTQSPPFTRDMQVINRSWHIPVQGNADQWVCINFLYGLRQREEQKRFAHLGTEKSSQPQQSTPAGGSRLGKGVEENAPRQRSRKKIRRRLLSTSGIGFGQSVRVRVSKLSRSHGGRAK